MIMYRENTVEFNYVFVMFGDIAFDRNYLTSLELGYTKSKLKSKAEHIINPLVF